MILPWACIKTSTHLVQPSAVLTNHVNSTTPKGKSTCKEGICWVLKVGFNINLMECSHLINVTSDRSTIIFLGSGGGAAINDFG